MAAGPRRNSTRSRIAWAVFGILLLVAGLVLYMQFLVQPNLWDALTNGANL